MNPPRRYSRHHRSFPSLVGVRSTLPRPAPPLGEFPHIDPAICIGCGGCVRACPEGDVLGLVGGLAKVVNGARCVGIGQCEKACPVGAIEMRVGALKGRADVPVMDDSAETTVPGVFIAGELGGLALIRNAINQGRDTMRGIAQRMEEIPSNVEMDVDVAIVGAGPAGMSAALTAVEQGLSYVILEQATDFGGTIFQYPRRKLTHTQPVELPLYGPLKKAEYSKEELLELFRELVERHDIDLRFGARVLGVESDCPGVLRVRTTLDEVRARAVLLATGRRGTPRKLGVPGENLPKVMYQVRDADHYKHQRILCVGGGDSAVEAAMGLARQPGNRVTISYRKAGFFRIKQKNRQRLEKMIKRGSIRPLLNSQVLEIHEQQVRLKVDAGEMTIDNDSVFVSIGGVPPFPLLRQIGIRFGDEVTGQTRG